MTETIRYGLIGKQDIKLEPRTGKFEVSLGDGRVVLLDAFDVAYLVSDAYPRASLPGSPAAGQLARLTDSVRGLWGYQGGQWGALNGELANVRDFGAKGDGTTNDAAAIQAALDAVPTTAPTGGIVFLPPGTYNLGTTSLLINVSGTQIVGHSGETSILTYRGTDFAIKNKGTTLRERISLRSLQIDTKQTDSAKAVDFTYFSNSFFGWLLLRISGNNTRGFYGIGTVAGSSPYYNIFLQNDVVMNNTLGGTSGSVGYLFDKLISGANNERGPNANLVMGGRIQSGDTHVRMKDGNGNTFLGVVSESARRVAHVHLGDDVPGLTGTATAGGANTLTDAAASFPAAMAGGAVKITGGTGSGQVRTIVSNTGTVLTLEHNWVTIPDATSTYSAYYRDASNNTIRDWYIEGGAGSDGVRLEPGAFRTIVEIAQVDSLGAGKLINAALWRAQDRFAAAGQSAMLIPFTFVAKNVAASQTSVALSLTGETDSPTEYVLPFDADIVGISLRTTGARTAGTLTVKPTSNGTEKTLSATLDANVTQLNDTMQPVGTEDMGGVTRRLGATITTSAAWAPTTADVAVTIWVVAK